MFSMKTKFSVLIIALSFITVTSFGQESDDKPHYFTLGPVAGFGHSWISDAAGFNQTFKPSWHLGAYLLYAKHQNWAFGGVLTASHEGFTSELALPFVGNITTTYNPVYVRAIPRVHYFFGKYTNNVRPKLYAGPSIGFKVVEDYTSEPTSPTPPEAFDSFDLGANVGAGVNIKVASSTWLNLDADYYHGFLGVTPGDNQNRYLRANVGVLFGL